MKRTLLTIKEQEAFFSGNYQQSRITHKWSSRGYGNSKIIDGNGTVLGKASGCGYDRYGAALGNMIMALFPEQVHKLAKRECKGRSQTRKGSKSFYGMFYNRKDDAAYLDGGCGERSMLDILNKIGFSLQYVNESTRSNNGEAFYILRPITKNERKWLRA